MLICQECRFVNVFGQSDISIVILSKCEAVVVKSFLLVIYLEQSSVFNHKANCVVNKRNFLFLGLIDT